ncbi:MAG: kinase/pyrophosphorylase [Bacteroidales bacterium]|nr:kinase/pyrophosphorylase [Bacteroidales bacterium]
MEYYIHIISDGTGKTAEQIVKAALVQFENLNEVIIIHSEVRTEEQIIGIFDTIIHSKCFVVHTVVSFELRNKILEYGRLYSIRTIDLMGPLLSQISSHLSIEPIGKPGAFHELNKAYFQRIDAIEFAIRHDDGLRSEELEKADIILIGVSRTFKTPLTIYLANLGWMTGNIPLVMDFDLPDIVYKLPHHKVFGLTTTPERLSILRKTRDEYLKSSTGSYSSLDNVRKELMYAGQIFSKHRGWEVIDVTNKSLEEIASQILSSLKKHYVMDFNKPV